MSEKEPTQLSAPLQQLADEAREIIAEGVPDNTRRTYQTQWRIFCEWCERHDQAALPASSQTLVLFLTHRAKEVKASTLQVALAAITVAHREAGHPDWKATDQPAVRVFMRGLKRRKGGRVEKKRALLLSDLKVGLPKGDNSKAKRDRALLLVGFFSAMRRSELVALNHDDVEAADGGYLLHIRTSKTDKDSEGQTVALPVLADKDLCPVRALDDWVAEQAMPTGPLFTSLRGGTRLRASTVAAVVKAAARQAGFDPADYAAHSLRSGFVTTAALADVDERRIMKVTRHRSERTVRGYMQDGTRMSDAEKLTTKLLDGVSDD